MAITYQLERVAERHRQMENEAFRKDFNAALRKNAKERIIWMLKERAGTRKSPDNEILPKELFEI